MMRHRSGVSHASFHAALCSVGWDNVVADSTRMGNCKRSGVLKHTLRRLLRLRLLLSGVFVADFSLGFAVKEGKEDESPSGRHVRRLVQQGAGKNHRAAARGTIGVRPVFREAQAAAFILVSSL